MKCTYDVINEDVWEWFCETRARNILITEKINQFHVITVVQQLKGLSNIEQLKVGSPYLPTFPVRGKTFFFV